MPQTIFVLFACFAKKQVSVEASGLDTLFGSGSTDAGEEEELMAEMSAMFLGVDIQPVIFFQGYSDLMSKYFSAEEGPMNILSGNVLVLKHQQVKHYRPFLPLSELTCMTHE